MKILCECKDGGIFTEDGGYIGVIPPNSELKEYTQENLNKTRVKQALKLKNAGFSGKEIIDIIGEIE